MKVLVNAVGKGAHNLVGLVFTGQALDGSVKVGIGRYCQARICLQAGGGEDVYLKARGLGGKGGVWRRAVEDEEGSI